MEHSLRQEPMPEQAVGWKRVAYYTAAASAIVALAGGGAYYLGHHTIGQCLVDSAVVGTTLSICFGAMYLDRSTPRYDDSED